jgi:hypothetical protein
MHLTAGKLVDIAEGTRPESAAPHLASCEACRAQLLDLRAMLSEAKEADVPEPSPLFWEHLSSRVREAVAEDAVNARLTPSRDLARPLAAWLESRAVHAGVAVVAALLIAVALGSRAQAPAPVPAPPAIVLAEAETELLSDVSADDASLTVMASLTDGLDLDTAREAGLAPRGSAEHAVTHMSDGELRELGRLLKEELAKSGA